MKQYERFGACLKRCLAEGGLSATEAAKMVGFRSRNSIFRILAGETGDDVNLRFLASLHEKIGDAWPQERWMALQEALSVERLGPERYEANCAFDHLLHEREAVLQAEVQQFSVTGETVIRSLADVLTEIAKAYRAEIVITGCCDSELSLLLEACCSAAGDQGRLNIRQYIDTTGSTLPQHILGILPLVSKPWYNARLVQEDSCPPEMMALYRMHALHICAWDEDGNITGGMLVRFDKNHFATQWRVDGAQAFMQVLDRMRFDLELLKPMPQLAVGAENFIRYTQQYAHLEENCTILSIKPDVHFNCIPTNLLYAAIIEGFERAGIAGGVELTMLMEELRRIHDSRYDNMIRKHRPTHLVYSLPAMKRFMETGVCSDHFFLQRAYTVAERREIIRVLLETMRENPWFNIHFLREHSSELRYEISYYDGKGVLLMDAYTGYELNEDHSEALITLPAFMESFRAYVQDELLVHHVMPREAALRELERLLTMELAD